MTMDTLQLYRLMQHIVQHWSALTSTRFLQHLQAGATSFKNIVKEWTKGAHASRLKREGTSSRVQSKVRATRKNAQRVPDPTACAAAQISGLHGSVLKTPTRFSITAVPWQNLLFASPEDLAITWLNRRAKGAPRGAVKHQPVLLPKA